MKKETVDGNIKSSNASWSFENIEEDFEMHIKKSIPHYLEWQNLVCGISDFFVGDDSQVYDLGSSTGALTRKLAARHPLKSRALFTGIEVVPSMVKKATELNTDSRVSFECQDLRGFQFDKSSLITAYYTIQFINPSHRQEVINGIYESLNWGGAFIMFEKVRGPDARFQDYMMQIYNDFKLENNFTAEEIIGKSRSLKGVLEPFSSEGNHGLLRRAGFIDVMPVAKWLCFEGVLAVK